LNFLERRGGLKRHDVEDVDHKHRRRRGPSRSIRIRARKSVTRLIPRRDGTQKGGVALIARAAADPSSPGTVVAPERPPCVPFRAPHSAWLRQSPGATATFPFGRSDALFCLSIAYEPWRSEAARTKCVPDSCAEATRAAETAIGLPERLKRAIAQDAHPDVRVTGTKSLRLAPR
jgi:hypothetical protein